MHRPALSIVVPCYNEEGCLEMLHARVSAAAKAAVGEDYEIVFVNDGSRDGTWPLMQRLAAGDPRLVAINLSRNHGHQLALTAGLDLCAGEQVLIIDADLQDPPELLGEMRAVMAAEQADVVYAVRRKRQGETLFKKLTAAGFYRVLDRVTDTPIPPAPRFPWWRPASTRRARCRSSCAGSVPCSTVSAGRPRSWWSTTARATAPGR